MTPTPSCPFNLLAIPLLLIEVLGRERVMGEDKSSRKCGVLVGNDMKWSLRA